MKRRNLVALVSVCVLAFFGLVVLATGWVVTRTNYGREQLRQFAEQQIASRIDGTFYMGRISGGLLNGITIDSIAIRDRQDSLFLATGPVTLTYDPRDLMDKRIHLKSVEVHRPVVRMRQYEDGSWTHKKIFRAGKPSGPRAPGRKFGDYIVAEWARIHDGEFKLSLPWHPDDSLRGAKLDSALRYNLARTDKEVRRYKDGKQTRYVREYHWEHLEAFMPRVRLAHPDSNRFGREIRVDKLAVEEHDPPFSFRNLRGAVRILGDSIWVTLPHFELPASAGSARGKIWWGSKLPTRYDIAVTADTVSLNDVSWVYPTLPRTGGGRTRLHIRNDRTNLRIMEYALTDMDVRTTKSRLRGNMTFAVGGPVLEVRDLDLEADPVDFDLIRAFNGKPFPVDWRGRLVGTVRGPGGPLNRFQVEDARVTFHDAHVPGATTRLTARGGLDILFPAFTKFRGLDVNVATLDLRTVQYLFPNFPRLNGTLAGVARLDSSWLDVRVSSADIVHENGPGDPSRITGGGRVTWGEEFMSYDMDLQAQPVSLTMLSRSYPALRMQGLMSGPVRVKGTVADLELTTTLTGEAGTVSFDGRLDVYPPGFAARGRGEAANLDLSRLMDRPGTAATRLSGQYSVNMGGDSLANAQGFASVALASSEFDGIRFFPSRGYVRFADGRLVIDTLLVESAAAKLRAQGALGVAPGVTDSVKFILAADSLGGLRRYLGSNVEGALATDSLAGGIQVDGRLLGRIDSLDVVGAVTGSDLYLRGAGGRELGGDFAIRDALRSPSGSAKFRLARATLGGIDLDTVGARFDIGKTTSSFLLTARGKFGSAVHGSGTIQRIGPATLMQLDTMSLTMSSSRWALAAPVRVVADSVAMAIDSLVLVNGVGGRIDVRGTVPDTARVALTFKADSVPLADVARVAQLSTNVSGFAFIAGAVGGTRTDPEITMSATGRALRVSDMSADRIVSTAQYRDRRVEATFELFHEGTSTVRATASLPMRVQLWSASRLNDSLRVSVRADSADLGIVEAFLPALQRGKGRLSAMFDVGGTWTQRTYSGRVDVANGELAVQPLGITLKGIQGGARLVPGRDSVEFDLRAWSGAGPQDFAAIRGGLNFANANDWRFDMDLTARNFHAIDRRNLARLDVSTEGRGLQLHGRTSFSRLSGNLLVNRGVVFLPDREIARKQLIDFSDEAIRQLGDTLRSTLIARRVASSCMLEGLRFEALGLSLGDDVWLRSREANVKLTGRLNVRTAVDELSRRRDEQFAENEDGCTVRRPALEGMIAAARGTYTLDLGPVQREFQVQRGTVTFQGTSDNNPLVDITAQYSVKRSGQEDLGIIVRLHGPFNPYPVIDLSSTANYEISQSDLVSYLVTGQPAFQLEGIARERAQTVAAVFLPSLNSVAAAQLREQFGSWVDAVQFQGGASEFQAEGVRESFGEVLASTRIGGEKQVSNNLFVSVSAGLCPLYQQDQADRQQISFLNTLGWKLEYRFDPKLSLQAGLEPSAAERSCGALGTSARGLVPTPRQWGLSLFRTWHF